MTKICCFYLHQDNDDALKKLTRIIGSASWGSIFGEDGGLMNTLFSSLVDEYSLLVIPGLDYLAGK